ncbi:MAG: ABC transporter ATP-binding protein [Verrucomicrobia bacterium]|nr:ABC transporter ATP-binding protein [Verrucomicrobiota bacterium]
MSDAAHATPSSRAPGADGDILIARGLRKTYYLGSAPLEVLKGIDLNVRRGERLAIVGASGAGKSTLMHLLGGLDRPSAGDIAVDGVSIFDLPAGQLTRFRNRQVGFIFQAYQLMPELTAQENVALPGLVARRPDGDVKRRAAEVLVMVGLGGRLHHRPVELSGGEQQRVAIARALINDPPLLFADEPTGNLDSATGGAVMDLLLRLQRERGMTLVMVTHDLANARHCQRVVEIRDGVLVGAPRQEAGVH